MSSLTKESDNPSEKVRKSVGDLDDNKKALVLTTDTVVKEGTTGMVDKKKVTVMSRNTEIGRASCIVT